MNPKIKKINAELDKNAAKIAELQARQKELIQQRTELENNDILELVHSHNMDINPAGRADPQYENRPRRHDAERNGGRIP